MLKERQSILQYDYSHIRDKFCELTNWECCDLGEWNAKFNKIITFKIDLNGACQHE